MTSALERLDVDASCLSQECEKQGCRMELADLPHPFLLIDMDHRESPAEGSSRCDYLLVGAEGSKKLYVVALELKSSGFRAVPVSRQLAGGAKTATAVVGKAPCRFVPVVAHDGAHRSQIDKLAKHPVRFRRRRYAIQLMKCGEYIADALA